MTTTDQIINDIRTDYTDNIKAAGKTRGDWIPILWIREGECSRYQRNDLDQALTQMLEEGGANLIPESQQGTLTAADRRAALWAGGQWKHLISIG